MISRRDADCRLARFVAYERVRDLWLWGYLERVELPVARVLGGRRPFLYALGLQAVPIVEHRMGTAVLPPSLGGSIDSITSSSITT